MQFEAVPFQGHSAHAGEDVVIHYRWHPLCGRRLRRHHSERRAGSNFVHVEVAPGVVTVVAAWMLDPGACTGMEIGQPRVAAGELADLHRLLTGLGFRTDSRSDSDVAQGSSDEASTAEYSASDASDDDGAGRDGPAEDDASGVRIPTQGGQGFRFDPGPHSDLMAATIPI